jgi:hypothetical protein
MARQKRREENNDFGEQTYWNQQPTGRRTQRLAPSYPGIKAKTKEKIKLLKAKATEKLKLESPPRQATLKSPSRSPSPTNFRLSQTPKHYNTSFNTSKISNATHTSLEEEKDAKDEKSIMKLMKNTLPQFSNEAD